MTDKERKEALRKARAANAELQIIIEEQKREIADLRTRYEKGVERACEVYRKELDSFIHLLNILNDGDGEIVAVEKSMESFRKALTEQ